MSEIKWYCPKCDAHEVVFVEFRTFSYYLCRACQNEVEPKSHRNYKYYNSYGNVSINEAVNKTTDLEDLEDLLNKIYKP